MKNNCIYASSLAILAAAGLIAQTPQPLNQLPSRIVGHPPEQLPIPNNWPNLVEGRELFSPEGVALDNSVSPPIVYVADTGNNRVLGWKNATGFHNGDKADLVIGQTDLLHTAAQGPGTTFSAGLSSPTGVLVDSNGNLFVADSNNNRILRFPKPFAQQNGQFPDLYLGQPNLSSKAANYTGAVSDQGLNLAGSPWPINMAFDPQNNLWLVDGGNRRVLRFANTDVAGGGGPLRANLVLGQLDFFTVQPSVGNSSRTTNNVFAYPNGIAFDSSGRLYVSDGLADFSVGRVLVFTPPFTSNQSAARIMGVFPGNAPSQDAIDKTSLKGPSAIFFAGGKMGVLDTFSSRILLFDTFDKWPDPATTFSPVATGVVGQPDFHNRVGNGSLSTWVTAASASTLYSPIAAAFSGTELYVSDSSNNRVVVLPLSGSSFGPAARVLGQDSFTMSAINLIEGREFAFLSITGTSVALDAGVAMDETTDTPHLYVADPYNHRVLGFKDFRKVQAGAKADIVLGQPDFSSNLCNVTGNPDGLTASSLCFPTGITVDAQGNLFVADTGNGRVLRFQAPFARQAQLQQADLVLGQHNFTTKITDPSASTMSQPYGLAFAGANGLLVSDVKHNRVLLFSFNSNGTFDAGTDNGKSASKVFGQPDFTTVTTGNDPTKLNAPHHISADNEARLYVADSANNRIQIFDQVGNSNTQSAGATAVYSLTGLSQPRGVFVNPLTSDIWIAEGGSSQARRFPKYVSLILNPAANYTVQAGSNVLALTQDQYGDLIVADGSSRVGFYFPGLQALNGGNFLPSRNYLAPGLLTSLCAPSSNCSGGAAVFGPNTVYIGTDIPNPFPMPTTLGDIQVLFNGSPAPLYYVSPTQINFVVPMNAPTSGLADIQVVQASTGRIFSAWTMPMNTASPAILMTTAYAGRFRQAAVINQDGTVNGPQNPAPRGSYISIYATGQGFVPGAPPDGTLVSGDIRTPAAPQVNINGIYLQDYTAITDDKPKDQWLYSSGLSQFPGLWQINAYVPKGVPAGNQVPLLLLYSGQLSTDANSTAIVTTIAVK